MRWDEGGGDVGVVGVGVDEGGHDCVASFTTLLLVSPSQYTQFLSHGWSDHTWPLQ